MAASLIVAVSIGWVGGTLTGRGGPGDDELVSTYLRVASSDHPVDVASTDRHTVKPWFAGRIDYSPPVLRSHVGRASRSKAGGWTSWAAARCRCWSIATTSIASRCRCGRRQRPNTAAKVTMRDGFAMAEWRHAGFEMHAVSDLAPSEMADFAAALDKAVDADR